MSQPHVLICYRNFHRHHHASHVGLGINGLHTARVLREHGILADPVGVWTAADVSFAIERSPYTHVIIEAPWIATADQQQLLNEWPRVQFAMRCHSQMAFLQVEPGAIKLLREAATLEGGSLNFRVAANSARFADTFQRTYHHPCLTLPNLYDCARHARYRHHVEHGRHLRIGSFGALRLMKNHTTAAAAALLLARRRKATLDFCISVNREEGPGAAGVLASIRNMFAGLHWAKLVEIPWLPWSEFRNMVGTVDLCFQLSHSETFNIVTADAASEGVPCVVTDVIDWVPKSWIANCDDAVAAAAVGDHLLSDPYAGEQGYEALMRYVVSSVELWKKYLGA